MPAAKPSPPGLLAAKSPPPVPPFTWPTEARRRVTAPPGAVVSPANGRPNRRPNGGHPLAKGLPRGPRPWPLSWPLSSPSSSSASAATGHRAAKAARPAPARISKRRLMDWACIGSLLLDDLLGVDLWRGTEQRIGDPVLVPFSTACTGN